MSYTILYRSMFAKLGDDKYIPMVEMGDNNVYEGYGRYERRARDWQNWRVPGKEKQIVLTHQEIMEGIHNLIQDTVDNWVNKPAREYDNIPGPYWTFNDVYKQYGWLTGIAISGKNTSMTTARMVRNFFNRGFEQAVNMHDVKYWGHFPIRLCYWENCEKRCFYYDTLDEFLEDTERRDGTKYWVEYIGVEPLWDYNRNRRNR